MDLDYDGKWLDLAGMSKERANSRYTLLGNGKHVDGNIVVANWNIDMKNLFYYAGENVTTVTGVNCTGGGDARDRKGVYLGEDLWGSVFTCDNGPSLTQNTTSETKSVTPPAIIMKRDVDGKEFLIVEESSSSPSFMYSVWNFNVGTNDSIELHPMFQIAATMRLAEAVVTGIVHGETTGGGCFGLLRRYSEMVSAYKPDAVRAVPFGECPDGGSDTLIEIMEAIDYGLKISPNVLLCFVLVLLLTSIGVVWSVCLRSSIGMDVYDRDELIRAVSLHGVAPGGTPPSDIRIFVRREDAGNISVVISDTGTANNACARLLRRGGEVVEDVEPSPVAATVDQYNRGFGGPDVPVGPRTVWLEGVRTGMGRPLPGPNGNYHYPSTFALSASPVPSTAGSLVSTPIHTPSRRARVMRGGGGFALGRGPSEMFDSAFSSSNSPEETPRGMQTARHGGDRSSAGASGRYPARVGGERPALAVSQATSASDIEMPPLSEHSFGNGEMVLSPVLVHSTPPRKRGLSRSRGKLGHLGQESEDDTEESSPPPDNLHEDTTECSPASETRLAGDE